MGSHRSSGRIVSILGLAVKYRLPRFVRSLPDLCRACGAVEEAERLSSLRPCCQETLSFTKVRFRPNEAPRQLAANFGLAVEPVEPAFGCRWIEGPSGLGLSKCLAELIVEATDGRRPDVRAVDL